MKLLGLEEKAKQKEMAMTISRLTSQLCRVKSIKTKPVVSTRSVGTEPPRRCQVASKKIGTRHVELASAASMTSNLRAESTEVGTNVEATATPAPILKQECSKV